MKKLFFILFATLSFSLHADTPTLKQVNLFLVGPGNVGKILIQQLQNAHAQLAEKEGLDIRVIGIASKRGMCFYLNGFPLENWEAAFKQYKEPMSLASFVARFTAMNLPHSIFVDCTSDQAVADFYPTIAKCGISIVTPNKKAGSGAFHDLQLLEEICKRNNVQYLFDANVGAGLPIIHTFKNQVRSGDQITKFEAVLSGTLSYIFNTFHKESKTFSEVVLEAQQKGYTEPDPRDDLNGMDFARKVLILARAAGYRMEMKDIALQQLLPHQCFTAKSVDEFYHELKIHDVTWDYLKQDSLQQGKKLCYMVVFENGKAEIRLQELDKDHPFYSLKGTENAIAINSKYYPENPLVIKGPGAGATVTASKVLANIVTVARTN